MASSHEPVRSTSKLAATATTGSGGKAQQGQQQELSDAGDAQPQQQQQQQQQGQQQDGRRLQCLLREVAGSDELLKDCIKAREELGVARMKIMRAREEARQASRVGRSPCSLVFDGERWDWSNDGDCSGVEDCDIFGSDTTTTGMKEREQLAATVEAGPLAREFADKMEELANIVPELSRSLVGLTATTRAARADSPSSLSAAGRTGGEGAGKVDFDVLPSDSDDDVQELIKVVCPALARLLSFEHLRASESTGRELVQALANLYVGMAPELDPAASQATASGTSTSAQPVSAFSSADSSNKAPGPATPQSAGARTPPSTGSRVSMDSGRATISASSTTAFSGASGASSISTSQVQQRELQREKLRKKATSWVAGIIKQMLIPKVYGGKLVRSKGLDELLGKRGVTAAHHERAVQVELLRNIEVLQSLTVAEEGFDLKRRPMTTRGSNGQPQREIDGGVRSAETTSTAGSSSISSNFDGQEHQKHRQPPGRKRRRSSIAAGATAVATWTGPGQSDSVAGGPTVAADISGTAHVQDTQLSSSALSTKVEQQCRAGSGSGTKSGGGNAGYSRLFRRYDDDHDRGRRREPFGVVDAAAFSEEVQQRGRRAWPAAAGGTVTAVTKEHAAAVLLESTLRSSCCMLETRGGHSGLPVQLLRARLQQDAYYLFPAPSPGSITSRRSFVARDSLLPPGDDHDALSSSRFPAPAVQQRRPASNEAASQARRHEHKAFNIDAAMSPPPTQSRRGSPSPLLPPPVPLPAALLLLSTDRIALPAVWEERVRGCLLALDRRPLLCPDTLLRETGAVPPSSSEVCVRGAVAAHSTYFDVRGSGSSSGDTHDGLTTSSNMMSGSGNGLKDGEFQLSEVCIRVGLNVVENAVLQPGEAGGEAAAGLLRAFRTVRNIRGDVSVHGGGAGREDQAIAGGCSARVKGEALFEFVATLDQTPAGCVETSLDVLVFALDELGKKHGRRKSEQQDDLLGSTTAAAAAASLTPLERPFEEELWLLVLGYRHWIMLAMVHLLSTDACGSCDTHQDKRQAPAAHFLAWYACGGCAVTGPPQDELAEAKEGVVEMATCLSKCTVPGDTGEAEPQSREARASMVAEACETGDRASMSPAQSASAQIAAALEAARASGQGSMGAIFSPCLALAWLLTSRVALCDCETVLACGVLREEDLEGAFRGEDVVAERDLALVKPSTHPQSSVTSSSCCIEAVLQGLAAIEDLVWLCSLSPPLTHVHKGQDLKTLLKRIRTWVSGLGRHPSRGDRGSRSSGGRGNRTLADFRHRRDAISQRLARLLLRL